MPTVFLHGELQNPTQISPLDLKKINHNVPKSSPISHDVHPVIYWSRVYGQTVKKKSSSYDGSSQASNSVNQCLTSRTPRSHFNNYLWFNSGNQKVPKQGNTCVRSTHRCLGLDEPGPSGFNERIHKKQVLPCLGYFQNYFSLL